jgi:integrase
MTKFEARLNLSSGNSFSPDIYDPLQGRIPPDNFVVSRHGDGRVASTYGDLSWDRTPYDPDGRTRHLNFSFWDKGGLTKQRENLTRELRWLMFLLIYMRPGNQLSYNSLHGYMVAFRHLGKLCEHKGIRVQDALLDPGLMLASIVGSENLAIQLGSLLTLLRSLGEDQVGFAVAGKAAIQELRSIARQWIDSARQYPPIPTGIYSAILSTLSSELSDLENVIDSALRLYADCRRDPLFGRGKDRQDVIRSKLNSVPDDYLPHLSSVIKEYDLDDYFEAKNISRNVNGLSTLLRRAMMIATLQIQAFTGMRQNEVMALPYNCLELIQRDGTTHYIICGRTTKLSRGLVKRSRWVTSSAGYRAVLLAQRIAAAIYAACGRVPNAASLDAPGHYLFVDPQIKFPRPDFGATELRLNTFSELRALLQPVIREHDLRELEQIDPHRAWRSEDDFQIGRPWKLTSHQFRRSLALYAQRSGLVSLPSLKRQLQHITHEMSSYYARGSVFAKNFIGDDKSHFGYEWQDTQPVSQYLSYAAHVLMTDDVLFGAHPHWLDHRLKNPEGIVMFDRDSTLKRFKQGTLAYRDSLLGGCVKVGECQQTPVDLFEINCLTRHCKSMVGSLRKLDRVITVQRSRVERLRQLDPTTPEYRNEVADLALLEATRENVMKKTPSRSED